MFLRSITILSGVLYVTKSRLVVISVRGILNSYNHPPGPEQSIEAGSQYKQMLCHYSLRGNCGKQRLVVRTSADFRTNGPPPDHVELIHSSFLPSVDLSTFTRVASAAAVVSASLELREFALPSPSLH